MTHSASNSSPLRSGMRVGGSKQDWNGAAVPCGTAAEDVSASGAPPRPKDCAGFSENLPLNGFRVNI
jgi:hypothetical protein